MNTILIHIGAYRTNGHAPTIKVPKKTGFRHNYICVVVLWYKPENGIALWHNRQYLQLVFPPSHLFPLLK